VPSCVRHPAQQRILPYWAGLPIRAGIDTGHGGGATRSLDAHGAWVKNSAVSAGASTKASKEAERTSPVGEGTTVAECGRTIGMRTTTALTKGARSAAGRSATFAHPAHALLLLCAAIAAAATVILVSLQVYAPVSAAGPARGTAANPALSARVPDAVPRAALAVAGAPAAVAPAVVRPGHPRYGGQGGPQERPAHQSERFAP
jgi:hypothetical protein